MTQEHPITPPSELVQQWVDNLAPEGMLSFATQAARWGADQELLACGNYLKRCAAWEEEDVTELYDYRRPRPKPPSLKELNLKHLEVMERDGHYLPEIVSDLRRAIESLPD